MFYSALLRKDTAPKFIKYLLEVCVLFYLGFNLILGGGVAEIPVVALSLIALVFFRSAEAVNDKTFKSRITWAFVILGFALWNCFVIWYHGGEIELYEPSGKILVGSLVAFALAYHRVKFNYIRVGIYLAAISLIYLFIFEYDGEGRFSNGMNPNKWAPLLLSYSVTSFLMIYYEKCNLLKISALFSWLIFSFMIILSASRSTTLIFFIVTLFIALYYFVRSRPFIFLFSFMCIVLVGYTALKLTSTPIESRMMSFSYEYKSLQNDNFTTSSGYRLVMWKGGLNNVQNNFFMGAGFNLAKVLETYEPSSKGERRAVQLAMKEFGSYHNTWIDALVSQGVIGFCILLAFFVISLILVRRNKALLMYGPLIAVGLNGFTESTLYMSILAGHLALAGAIFMNIEDGVQS